jgi:hypothetical protein
MRREWASTQDPATLKFFAGSYNAASYRDIGRIGSIDGQEDFEFWNHGIRR